MKLISPIFFLINILSAQDIFINGIVTHNNEPIKSASIYYYGTSFGVISDDKGEFSIKYLEIKNPILIISYLGYKTKSIELDPNNNELGFIELDSENSLNEVVISGTIKSVSKLDSPIPVEVYSKDFFKSNPSTSVFEALERINGIRPQINCNVCNTGDIQINGQNGSYTMFLVDGLPIISGLSTVYGLSGIPQSLIEQIEIIKGPVSTIYGSEAIGGVINLITKLPDNSPKISFDSFITGWGELNTDLSYKYYLSNKSSGLFGINLFNYSNPIDNNRDGFTDITLQNRISIFNKLTINKKLSIATRFLYEDRWGGQNNWTPKFRGGNNVYGESVYTNRLEIFGDYKFNKNIILQFSFNDHNQNSAYGTNSLIADQTIGFGQIIISKRLKKNTFMSGLAYRYTYYDDNTTATFDYKSNFNKPSVIHLPGIFLQNQTNINDKNTLLVGIRYDYNSIHGSILTPRLNYKINNHDKSSIFRLSLGSGYRVVQVFTEEHAALSGARDIIFLEKLNPERSFNINLNFFKEIFLSNGTIINYDISLFKSIFSNKIIPDYETDSNKIIFGNLDGKSISNGGSINLSFLNSKGIRINFGTTYVDSMIKENGISTRPYLIERFQGTWSLRKKWISKNISFDITGKTTGPIKLPRLGFLDPRPPYSKTFSIINFQLTKMLKNDFEIFSGIKNLLNFTPPNYIISRSFDPFDKLVKFDSNGDVVPSIDNPYAMTFDPTYAYAPNQGLRFFIGLKWIYN